MTLTRLLVGSQRVLTAWCDNAVKKEVDHVEE